MCRYIYIFFYLLTCFTSWVYDPATLGCAGAFTLFDRSFCAYPVHRSGQAQLARGPRVDLGQPHRARGQARLFMSWPGLHGVMGQVISGLCRVDPGPALSHHITATRRRPPDIDNNDLRHSTPTTLAINRPSSTTNRVINMDESIV
jgi:hypothetical protein